MKILVAIKSNRPTQLKDKVLSWAPRGGYNIRLFVPQKQVGKAETAILDANYNHYLDMQLAMIVPDVEPLDYAKQEGYDLVLELPNIRSWNNGRNRDKMIFEYAADVGKARQALAELPDTKQYDFVNGARLVRV